MEFELAGDVTENYNVTYYATDIKGGITVQAVASVREGKCELKGATKKPTLVFVTTRNSRLPLVIYADKGNKIEISGDDKDPLNWNVEGNTINDSISNWRNTYKALWKECNPDSVNKAVADYVVLYPENPVSAILMLCYFDRKNNEREYTELMGELKGEAKDPGLLKIIGRADQPYNSYSFPARLESIILRSVNKGGDTLKMDKKNPAMLVFWETGHSERKDMIDSLKALEKEFPDSSRLIADICLDIDSVAWRNAMKKDSLNEEMKRFWVPSSLSDPTMKKLKVDAIPYFIVFDKEGVQFYRGTEISEAIKEYRHLFNAKDSL